MSRLNKSISELGGLKRICRYGSRMFHRDVNLHWYRHWLKGSWTGPVYRQAVLKARIAHALTFTVLMCDNLWVKHS